MKNKWFKLVKWIIAVVILYFLVDYFVKNYSQVDWSVLSFDYRYLIIGIVLVIISNLLWPVLWRMIVKRMGYNIKFLRSCRIFFTSQIGRYVPGKAMLLLTRIYLTEKQGVGRKEAFTSVVLDLALFSLSGVLLFLMFLPFFTGLPNWIIYLSILFSVVFLVFIHPRILESIINLGLRIFKKEELKINFNYGFVLLLLVLHVLRWFVHGIGLFFLLKSIIDVPFVLFWLLPGIVSLSIVLGMLVLISPGGLGVREGIIVLLLSPFVVGSVAIVFSILARLLLSVVEVILAGLFELIVRRKKIFKLLLRSY